MPPTTACRSRKAPTSRKWSVPAAPSTTTPPLSAPRPPASRVSPAPNRAPYPRIPRFREARYRGTADRRLMNETLTARQLRLVALLLGVVVIAGGYWFVVAKHKTSSPSTSSTPVSTTPKPSKTHTHTATPPARKLATHGLPVAVARALREQ